jgi:glc operon protein GlcG
MSGLHLDLARSVADAVIAAAAARGASISVAVVDARGELVASLRMDGAPGFTPSVARAKARTSVLMGADSGALAGLKADYPELVDQISDHAGFRITTLPGSLLVRDGGSGAVLGAVAVSGAHPDDDVACAEAGRAVWTA